MQYFNKKGTPMDKDLKKLSEEEYEQFFGGVEKGIFNRAGDPVMTNKEFNEEVRELMLEQAKNKRTNGRKR